MRKRFDVVGVGLNAIDYLCIVPHYPRFNSKVKMLEFRREAGGQIATALVALSRWGLKTAYIGKVGDDEWGNFTRRELKRERVDITGLVIARDTISQFAFIMVDQDSGERTIVWHRSDQVNLEPEELNPEIIKAGRFLHLDGHETDSAIAAAHLAREAGMKIVLDIDSINPKTPKLVSMTHILVSDGEFPCNFTGQKDPLKALRHIQQLGPEVVAMTLGKEGSLAIWGDRVLRTPGFEVRAVDTTGAGDLFHAGIIYSLLQGWDPEDSLIFANAVAALSCQKLGGRSGIPPLKEVKDFCSGL
jgi:sugar/nucleoside kinase (ribokinase family)